MEIPWRFHGDSMVGHPPAQRPPARPLSPLRPGLEPPGRAWSIGSTSGSRGTTPGSVRILPGSLRTLLGSLRTLRRSRDLPEEASDHRKRYQNDQNHENRRKWTHMPQFGLRIGVFESHSHFQSIANPPRHQIPRENHQNPHFSKNQKIRKPGNPPGSAAMGGAS